MLLLGEPSPKEIRDMKPKSDLIIPRKISQRLTEYLTSITKSDLDCVQFCLRLFQYSPVQRLTASLALTDKYYDEIHPIELKSIMNEKKSLSQLKIERTKN
jgi:glycogen synthase kinase 3 beta